MYNLSMNKQTKKKNVLSLFSGCGGMDLGFEGKFSVPSVCINKDIHPDWIKNEKNNFVELQPTFFNLVFANDIMDIAKTAWNSYFKKFGYPEDVFHLQSIVDLVKAHKNGEYKFPEDIDVVTGGFPCQDFSVAGKRKGFNSEKSHNGKKENYDIPTTETRGMLYLWMKEVIEITKPKIFIAENVKGLVSFGDVKNIIENDFRNIDNGYLVVPARVLFAGDYGVPQKRERVIFIGFNKKYLKKEALEELCKESYSLAEVLRKAGRKQAGGNQETLKKNNSIDFDDIIMLTVRLFLENPDRLLYYQNKFNYIYDFLDTNLYEFNVA